MEPLDPGGTRRVLNATPFYQCIKASLKSVVRDESVIATLRDAALRANGIMTHTLQLLKLYLLHCYETGAPLPTIDRRFVTSVMKVLCAEPTVGRPPSEATRRTKGTLRAFYEAHYKPSVVGEELNYRYLSTVLDYLAVDVITMYETNINQHFVEYVERFVNVSWEKKALVALIKKQQKTTARRQAATNALCAQLRRIKTDLLSPDQPKTAHPMYHAWIDMQRLAVLPRRALRKDSVHYDLQCSPQDYLHPMLYMMRAVEARGATVNNACPLRREIIPRHFRLDTTALVTLCLTAEQGTKSEYLANGNLVRRQAEIWGLFFKTDKKCFHMGDDAAIGHAHTFDHQIETDGVSCSILLKRRDVVGKRAKEPKTKTKKGGGETYVDEVDDYAPLRDKRVVAIDPNMSDLLYCVDGDTNDQTKFRYTQDQRRKETKAKKYRDYLQERKQETTVDGRRVVEWEAELSAFNRKTTDFAKFKAYIQKKNELNARLAPFYNAYIFRKLKLGSYMRRQITEARLLARFKKLFGGPDETVVAIGDFEQRKHRKYKEPVKGKGFRTLFRKAGYEVYLVDEFRTSCRCSACGGECKTFRVCENPRPFRTGSVLRHGLVKCKTCSRLWNRDTNAASNIWKIAASAIRGESRPDYLRRARGSISGATSATTQP
jgi:hypothetical protein